jgi:hypothetical protein
MGFWKKDLPSAQMRFVCETLLAAAYLIIRP